MAVDARTDIVASPAGRSDRLHTYGYGIGRAYVLRGGKAQLVWCGKALYAKEDAARWASTLRGDAARALSYPFSTKWGRLPVETGGMDVYSSFAGSLTSMTLEHVSKKLSLFDRLEGENLVEYLGKRRDESAVLSYWSLDKCSKRAGQDRVFQNAR